jgi:hypothetical protein
MTDIWETKDGLRRVRRDPPTLEEAVLAAQGLTEEPGEQAEIVSSLMQIPVEQAKSAVRRLGPHRGVDRITIAGHAGRTGRAGASGVSRAVVVERRAPRRRAVVR